MLPPITTSLSWSAGLRNHKLSSSAQRFIDLLRQPEPVNGFEPPKVRVFSNGTGAAAHGNDPSRHRNGHGRGAKSHA